jgi:hypothetical protein
MALTVPGTQTLRSAKQNHNPAMTLLYESVDVRRAIPEAKVGAVKTVLANACDSKYGIDYGGTTSGPCRDGRGFRARFKAMQTEAQVNTFLAAVETAVTT